MTEIKHLQGSLWLQEGFLLGFQVGGAGIYSPIVWGEISLPRAARI